MLLMAARAMEAVKDRVCQLHFAYSGTRFLWLLLRLRQLDTTAKPFAPFNYGQSLMTSTLPL